MRGRIQPKLDGLADWIVKAPIKCDVFAYGAPPAQAGSIRSIADKFVIEPTMAKELEFSHILRVLTCDDFEIGAPDQGYKTLFDTLFIEQVKSRTLDSIYVDRGDILDETRAKERLDAVGTGKANGRPVLSISWFLSRNRDCKCSQEQKV